MSNVRENRVYASGSWSKGWCHAGTTQQVLGSPFVTKADSNCSGSQGIILLYSPDFTLLLAAFHACGANVWHWLGPCL